MTFIANHLWLLPLAATILVTILFVWFIVTVEGEDTMATPLVFLLWLIVTLGSWGIYGLYHFIAWLF